MGPRLGTSVTAMSLLAATNGAGAAGAAVIIVVALVFAGFLIASMWKLFTKAGYPGWYAIIPILNTLTLIKIAGRPDWWIVLCLIPCVSFVVIAIVYLDLAKAFGKSAGFGVGMLFLPFIFLPILAFGDSTYVGVAAQTGYDGYAPYNPGVGVGQGAGFNQVGGGYTPTAPAAAAVPAAGWYPDPSGTGQRYWDGAQWSEHTAP